MPRITRSSLETSFFHIMVQGVNKEYIFNDEKYMNNYMSLINKYKEEYNIEIIAYCIMNNHAHLLVFSEKKNELSSFMHKINFVYAQDYNKNEQRIGHVFRDRFLSEGIYSERYLINCINYIHQNPVKAGIVKTCDQYKYSTYDDYKTKTGVAKSRILNEVIGESNYDEILQPKEEDYFLDIDLDRKEILENVISNYIKKSGKELNQILEIEDEAKDMIKTLKDRYRITYKEMREKFNISERKLKKLII